MDGHNTAESPARNVIYRHVSAIVCVDACLPKAPCPFCTLAHKLTSTRRAIEIKNTQHNSGALPSTAQ
eukprot:543308-Pelagomonas_calceolata.AAC.2